MRILLLVAIAVILAGCSRTPDVPDLTEEQTLTLQALGEMLDPHRERVRKLHTHRLWSRLEAYKAAIEEYPYGSAAYKFYSERGLAFTNAESNLLAEYSHKEKIDGSEKAADWYVTETNKSDDQVIEDWSTPPRG